MIKNIIGIEGMMCPHCEAHMIEAIKKTFGVEEATASHQEKKAEFLSAARADEELARKTVADAGYTFTGITFEEV